jgi:aerobic carbon-monoxide dehydrogenase medium subunit
MFVFIGMHISKSFMLGCLDIDMIPAPFEYSSPKSLVEAVALLQKSGPDSKILAGGQSLIPVMKLRLGSPSHLIDINNIDGLSYIIESDGHLKIGALTRMSDLESSELLEKKYPIISDAAREIADPTVRNLGTAGGNLSHADPANDLPAVMIALRAEFVLAGPNGIRTVNAKDFFLDAFTTALNHDEIMTEIRSPQHSFGTGSAYMKLEKRAGDFAIAGVGVSVMLDKDGNCSNVGIGLTAVGQKTIEAQKAEEFLMHKKLTDDTIAMAAKMASEAAMPVSDLRGPAEYKTKMVRVLTSRALRRAYMRAIGGA